MMASEYEQTPIFNRGVLTRYRWCKFHWSMLVQSHRHQTCQPSHIGTLKVEEGLKSYRNLRAIRKYKNTCI
jgi:hypothetical protein